MALALLSVFPRLLTYGKKRHGGTPPIIGCHTAEERGKDRPTCLYYIRLHMKYLIASDLHGSIAALDTLLTHYDHEGCEMLLLLGDLLNYGPRNGLPSGLNPTAVADRLNTLARSIIAVRGNCDSEVDQMLLHFPILTDYAWVVDEGRRIFLTHGHVYSEERQPQGGFDLLCQGHTHLPHITPRPDGSVCLNTGSPTFPKGGNPPTFALLDGPHLSIRTLDGQTFAEHQLTAPRLYV